jgi:hypothetical protein
MIAGLIDFRLHHTIEIAASTTAIARMACIGGDSIALRASSLHHSKT